MPESVFEWYNYDSFIPANFEPMMRFDQSPPLGQRVSDFPLWNLDGQPTSLYAVLKDHSYTVVEFGSFT